LIKIRRKADFFVIRKSKSWANNQNNWPGVRFSNLEENTMFQVIDWQLVAGNCVVTTLTLKLNCDKEIVTACSPGSSVAEAACGILKKITNLKTDQILGPIHRNGRTELSLMFADSAISAFEKGADTNLNTIKAIVSIYNQAQARGLIDNRREEEYHD
jgi:hypothetical protein